MKKYNALVSMDLPGIKANERNEFYGKLEKYGWTKIKGLATTWEANIKVGQEENRVAYIDLLKVQIEKARIDSKIKKVCYAIQLSLGTVTIGEFEMSIEEGQEWEY